MIGIVQPIPASITCISSSLVTTNSPMFDRCSLGQSINMFSFFPRDLYKFYCKILICPSLDKVVVLHSISFGFVVFVDSPVSITSYLASLLAVWNWSRMVHSMTSSSKDCRTTPIPPTCLLDDLSVQTFHRATTPLPFPLFIINFVTKSANS